MARWLLKDGVMVLDIDLSNLSKGHIVMEFTPTERVLNLYNKLTEDERDLVALIAQQAVEDTLALLHIEEEGGW